MTAAEAQEESRRKMVEAAEAAVPKASNADLFASPEDAKLIMEAKAANKDSKVKGMARDFVGQYGFAPKSLTETMATPEFTQYADRIAPKPEQAGVMRDEDKAKISAARANMTPEQQARIDAMSGDVAGMKTGREAFAPKEDIPLPEKPMFKALPAKVTPEQAAAMVPESVDRYQEEIEKPRIRAAGEGGGKSVPAWIPEAKAGGTGPVATVAEKPAEAAMVDDRPTDIAGKIKKGGINFADVVEALAKGYTHDTTKTNLQERREEEYKEKENEFFRKLSGEKETAAEQRALREAQENERIYKERMALANFYETQQARERYKNELALRGPGETPQAVSVFDRYGGE